MIISFTVQTLGDRGLYLLLARVWVAVGASEAVSEINGLWQIQANDLFPFCPTRWVPTVRSTMPDSGIQAAGMGFKPTNDLAGFQDSTVSAQRSGLQAFCAPRCAPEAASSFSRRA